MGKTTLFKTICATPPTHTPCLGVLTLIKISICYSKYCLELLNYSHAMPQCEQRLTMYLVLILNQFSLGHVDAGKSTLMGHMLYLLGNVNKRTMHKYEQESKKAGKASFAYAWVLDETGEERER